MGKKHNSLFQLDNFCSSPSSSRINSLICLIFCSDFGWLIPCVRGSCERTDHQILPSSSKNGGPDCLRGQLFSLVNTELTKLSRWVLWLYKQGQEKGLSKGLHTENTELYPFLHPPKAKQFVSLVLPDWPHQLCHFTQFPEVQILVCLSPCSI